MYGAANTFRTIKCFEVVWASGIEYLRIKKATSPKLEKRCVKLNTKHGPARLTSADKAIFDLHRGVAALF